MTTYSLTAHWQKVQIYNIYVPTYTHDEYESVHDEYESVSVAGSNNVLAKKQRDYKDWQAWHPNSLANSTHAADIRFDDLTLMQLQSAATFLDAVALRILQIPQQQNSQLTPHFSALAYRGASVLLGGLQGLPAKLSAQSPM